MNSSRQTESKPRKREIRDLRKRGADLQARCLRLAEQLADGKLATSPETLVSLLVQREQALVSVPADLQRLESRSGSTLWVAPEQIRKCIDEFRHRLLDFDRRSGPLLAQLLKVKTQAVPYQQFGCSTVVLRAVFDFGPVGILPESLPAALSDAETDAVATLLLKKRVVTDLFDVTPVPVNAIRL